jgi:hypothetical protein
MVSGSLATLSADSPRLLRWFSAAPAVGGAVQRGGALALVGRLASAAARQPAQP